MGDDGHAGPLRPDPELIDRGRAERVGGGEEHAAALGGVARSELADRRRLAGPVDADDEHDRGPALDRRLGRPRSVARNEQRRELGADGGLGSSGIAAAAGPLDDFHRERARRRRPR